MKLSDETLKQLITDCMYRCGEDQSNAILVDGITANFGFHPERLEAHREDITSLLEQLPDDFKESVGGGCSFLDLCMDKDDNQWTDYHKIMEILVVLGIAIGKVKFCLPEAFWSVLPGGMPYVKILD